MSMTKTQLAAAARQLMERSRPTGIKLTLSDDCDNVLHEESWDGVEGAVCPDCGEVHEGDPDELEPSYECGACGTQFLRSDSADGDSARCPDCNKFAARLARHACPECTAGDLDEPVWLVPCPKCEDLIAITEMGEHYAQCSG